MTPVKRNRDQSSTPTSGPRATSGSGPRATGTRSSAPKPTAAPILGRRPARRVATEEVIAAAVEIVDAEGVEALTMRRLGQACGLSPMGIYRHVRDKDELLDRVVDSGTANAIDDIVLAGPWRDDVRMLFDQARQFFLDHPGVARLSIDRPTPVPAVARFFDLVLAALAAGGFTGADAVRTFDALLMFTFGSVLWQIPRIDTARGALVAVARGDAESAHVMSEAATLARRDPDEYFAFGIGLILDGLDSGRRSP